MKDLLGGGASREEMLVWIAEVQTPKVEHSLCAAQRHIKEPLEVFESAHYFLSFCITYFP